MSAQQCPGPLTVRANGDANSYALLTSDGKWLISLLHNGEALTEQQQATMRRLAACWNLLRGFTTEQLETGLAGMVALTTQRDELLTALLQLTEDADSLCATFNRYEGDTPEDEDTHTHDGWAEKPLQNSVKAARAAIAKATGSA